MRASFEETESDLWRNRMLLNFKFRTKIASEFTERLFRTQSIVAIIADQTATERQTAPH